MAMIEREPTLEELMQFWQEAKQSEKAWQDRRRLIEDEIAEHLTLTELEGVQTVKAGAYVMKVTQRINRTVNADALHELAIEAGLEAQLRELFRWKPEINLRQWNNADDSVRKALEGAITSKPGRPSFALSNDKEQ
jgi:hypothetical protein